MDLHDQDNLDLTRSSNDDFWNLDYRQFESNGCISAEVSEETGFVVSEGDMLAAFVGDELRGAVKALQVPFKDN